MLPPLSQPLALVTGGAHRLGKAFALSLARMGYALLLHYHTSEAEAHQTADEIHALGVPVYLAQADLSQPDQIRALFSQADSIFHLSSFIFSPRPPMIFHWYSTSGSDSGAALTPNRTATKPFFS